MRVAIISRIRESMTCKVVMAYAALSFLAEICYPSVAWALTSGPAQEEFASFEPVSTTDMVDINSGDFNYNIPLLSVPGPNGGYPINLAYHSGVGMEQEASWVGLGWNVNVGAINRQLRGLPDDFKGDNIKHKYNLRDNVTVGIDYTKDFHEEQFGFPTNEFVKSTQVNWQVYYNTYKGLGYKAALAFPRQSNDFASINLSFDSQNGIGIDPQISAKGIFKKITWGLNAGLSINSRSGLQSFSFGYNLGKAKSYGYASKNQNNFKDAVNKNLGTRSSALDFSLLQSVPSVSIPIKTRSFPFEIRFGNTEKEPLANTFGYFESHFPLGWSGFASVSHVPDKGIVNNKGYGYLYTGESSDPTDMKDFQRENIEYSKKVHNLAPSSFTYDLFSQTGQGTGGMFRPYYSSIGVLTDAARTNVSRSFSINAEVGLPAPPPALPQPPVSSPYHFGLGLTLSTGKDYSGEWDQVGGDYDNHLSSTNGHGDGLLTFGAPSNAPEHENAYFQYYGEKSGKYVSDDQLAYYGNDDAIRVNIDYDNDQTWLNRQFVAKDEFVRTEGGSVIPASSKVHKKQREPRATNIQMLTATEAARVGVGLTRNINNSLAKPFSKAAVPNMGHHISEVSVLQPDGMRYIYGLPAYNLSQMDAVFSVADQGNFNTATVAVPPNGNDIDLSGTLQKFLSQTELEPYVHSWMLTAVVSSDYIDLTGNGPTEDDYGYWVKFNYDFLPNSYKWRVPYEDANFIEGNKGDMKDNKASFTYGEKELYYLKSIETKTHRADFILTDREDGLDASGKFGTGAGTNKMKKLDVIRLFTKGSSVPIKSINFKYSYALCANVPNNSGVAVTENIGGNPVNINANKGKLTLRKLFFTYENSTRGELSPYVFRYASPANTDQNGNPLPNTSDNPDYNIRNMDRWGNYKPNIPTYTASSNYPYIDFPYTDQEQVPLVDKWTLKDIDLPSGGTIHVDFESDDYAYEENKPATAMFDIRGLGTLSHSPNSDRNQSPTVQANNETHVFGDGNNYRVYFKLHDPVPVQYNTPALQSDYILKHYIRGISKVYFKTYVDLKGFQNPEHKDYVSGYADIVTAGHANGPTSNSDYYGVDGTNTYGYITLKAVDVNEFNMFLNEKLGVSGINLHPFRKAAFQHLKVNRPEIAHTPVPQDNNIFNQIVNTLGSFITAFNDVTQAMFGFNQWARTQGFGKMIDLNGWSVIRLCDPDGFKYGGGVRVNRLAIRDNWVNTNAATDGFEYGQSYDYTTTDENGTTISSGVAYEPRIGGDESALKSPIDYELSTPLAATQNLYVETPVMDSYYPGQSVGYSKVTVRSIAPAKADLDDDNILNQSHTIKKTQVPVSIYEFYTQKDFPVQFSETDLSSHRPIKRPILIPGLYSSFKKRTARSQGYSVVLNDMAGKLKSLSQQTESGKLLSQQKYVYQTVDPYNPNAVNRLSNKVQVLNPDASTFQTAIIGQSHDLFVDMNENRQRSKSRGADVNLDIAIPPGVPFFIMPLPNISNTDMSLRTVVTNKIIYRTGIVKEVITTTDESVIKTENLAYDMQTGEALLTKVTNEYRDPVYNYSYPANWFYSGMGGAYKNTGVEFTSEAPLNIISVAANGKIDMSGLLPTGKHATDYFATGDEVYIDYGFPGSSGTNDGVYTVAQVTSNSGVEFINCIKAYASSGNGQYAPVSSNNVASIKVVRSGYRNLLSHKAGNLIAHNLSSIVPYNSANDAGTTFSTGQAYSIGTANRIIDASALEFSDRWQMQCIGCSDITYVQNFLGVVVNPWRIGLRGIWRPKRSWAYVTQRDEFNTNRLQGFYKDFTPFTWANVAARSPKWVDANTITKYSPHGFELENRDAIGRFSSAVYGYNNSLVTLVASNSRYREVAFDGFEDYPHACGVAGSDHFSFTDQTNPPYSGTYFPDNTQAHSGKRSVKIAYQGSNVFVVRDWDDSFDCDATLNNSPRVIGDTTLPDSASRNLSLSPPLEYTSEYCDCIGRFAPIPDKKYFISFWVKEIPNASTLPVNSMLTYSAPNVSVQFYNGTTLTADPSPATNSITYVPDPSTPIIEGWQRVIGTFHTPPSANNVVISLVNASTGVNAADVYFDDIRIHPFDGNMVSYVYDNVSLKLSAELDANNYATFYVYDDEGNLTKVKKETERGIATIREGRINNVIK